MSKPLPILPQMPWNVKQMIVNSANAISKHQLRFAAKEYKNLVTHSPVYYGGLDFVYENRHKECRITLDIDKTRSLTVWFQKIGTGYTVKKLLGREGTFKNGDFFEAIANHIARIFRNPKAHFGRFLIAIDASHSPTETYNEIKESIFKPLHLAILALGHLISFRGLNLGLSPTNEELFNLLSYSQPGYFKYINVRSETNYMFALPESQRDLSRVVELEQWKQASELLGSDLTMRAPFQKWSHFTRIELYAPDLTFDEAKQLIEIYINSSHFRHGRVRFQSEISHQLFDHSSSIGTQFRGTRIRLILRGPKYSLILTIDHTSQSFQFFTGSANF